MPYNDIFTNDVYQNEHDEDMTRKHPNYYKAIKSFFPEVYKLPEDEITPMIDILKNQGDTYDEAASLVKDYINQQEPHWQKTYFIADMENDDNNDDNDMQAHSMLQPMTDFQRQQAYQLARQIRPKNITISESDYNLATSPWARNAALIYQGMANAAFNPFGYAARGMDMDTRPVDAQNGFERALERSSGMLYDTIPFVAGGEALAGSKLVGNLVQSANPWVSNMGKGIQYLSKPSAPAAEIGGAIGGAALPAAVNLQYPGENASFWDKSMYYGGNLGLGLLGGVGGAGASLGLRSGKNLAVDEVRNQIDGYKIGKAYDRLSQNPLEGKGTDVIAEMKMRNEPNVVLQRGEAIIDDAGNVITSGAALMKKHGTRRNYGLNKIMYKHDMPRDEVMQIPRILRKNKPVEINERGLKFYNFPGNSEFESRLSLTPQKDRFTVSSMYHLDRE